jgi:DNA-binding NtrC family response regulator
MSMSITDSLKEDLRRAKSEYRDPVPKKVLIVDDNMNDSEMLESALKNIGFEVDVAPGGDAAISMVKASRPYARVFLDLAFPKGESGGAILASIRHLVPEIPVAIITGSNVTESLIQVANEVNCQIIQKPASEESLRSLMGVQIA